MNDMDAKITVAEFEALCGDDTHFLGVFDFTTLRIGHGQAVCALPYDVKHARSGETVGGPAIMALADFSLWVAIVGAYGPAAKAAVTTSLSVNFLRPAGLSKLICEAELVKAGRSLAVGTMTVRAAGDTRPVAHVTGTYSVASLK